MLPATTGAEAIVIINRMLAQISSLRPFPDHPEFFYSCSAGVASVIPGEAQSELYARADEALYRAKSEGKNRVCVAEIAA